MRELGQLQRRTLPAQISHHAVFRRLALIGEHPLLAGLFALVWYCLFAFCYNGFQFAQSTHPYYVYLADALLHGQLALRAVPVQTSDLSFYRGGLYLYWGPLPALLFMPFVALFGIATSDIFLTAALGALNVAMVALLLRRASVHGIARLTRVQRGVLVLFFAFGTVHTTLAPHGNVWFTGQLVGLLCVLLTYIVALSQRGWPAFLLCGIAIAGALMSRNHMLFAGIWPAAYLLVQHRRAGWRLVGYMLAGLAPVALGGALLLAYNQMRFGSIFDNGLAYHHMAPFFRADYARYGLFNLHYLPTNIYYQYIAYPFPMREDSPMGGSLFLLSPVFFGAIVAVIKGYRSWNVWLLVASMLVVSVPILLLMGTGWVQFGPRYTLDFYVPLLLLTAIGIRRWPMRVLLLAVAISVVHYVIGAALLP